MSSRRQAEKRKPLSAQGLRRDLDPELTLFHPALAITCDSPRNLVVTTFTLGSASEAMSAICKREASVRAIRKEYSQSHDRVQVRVVHLGRNVCVPFG